MAITHYQLPFFLFSLFSLFCCSYRITCSGLSQCVVLQASPRHSRSLPPGEDEANETVERKRREEKRERERERERERVCVCVCVLMHLYLYLFIYLSISLSIFLSSDWRCSFTSYSPKALSSSRPTSRREVWTFPQWIGWCAWTVRRMRRHTFIASEEQRDLRQPETVSASLSFSLSLLNKQTNKQANKCSLSLSPAPFSIQVCSS